MNDTEVIIRLLAAVILGGLIGLEREAAGRAAGLRTHILVCVGSTLIMLTSIYLFEAYAERTQIDPGRLAAQVVSGIGFLGAGTIIRMGTSVKGLTTAASLWVVSAVGLAVGCGFLIAALFTTLLVLLGLIVFGKIVHRYFPDVDS
jgi:putative Mg2+ transporter-C (MgtC) family protein